MLRNTSYTSVFSTNKRFRTKFLSYHVNVPFYDINLKSVFKASPVKLLLIISQQVLDTVDEIHLHLNLQIHLLTLIISFKLRMQEKNLNIVHLVNE